MADVKWIKLTTDMFDNRKIKHLRRLPDGNNVVLIWVMLLTMAGRCNANGMIFLTENIPYTPKMLADELDFEENTVQLALQALEQLNMIVTDNGFFTIAGWEEYQNIEGMEKIREQNRLRKQRQREREKLLLPVMDDDVSRELSRDVTQQNKKENKKEEKDIEEKNTISDSAEPEPSAPVKKSKSDKPAKHKHGDFQHVLLTENEYEKLANDFGIDLRDKAIKFLDEYIEEKGYKSKSHNLAIRRWVIDAVKDQEQKKGRGRKEPVPSWMNKKSGAEKYLDYGQRKYSADELDDLEAKLSGVKTAGNDPGIAARAEELKKQFS